jgi:hypothetical protein
MIMLKVILAVMIVALSFTQAQVYNNFLSDTFGYSFLDSDTIATGAPTFNWVSIYNRGTRIIGLADDNVKGPAPIGFSFRYYWGMKSNLYIGSNGYISFDDDFLSAQPFQTLPSCQKPNNIIAPLMADLDFSVGSPSCWYWTNAVDTFIVEFDSVQFWSTGGLATFQIILCQSDSSITFQYHTVQGAPFGGWSSANSNTIGIENSIGNIGIQYLKDGSPASNLLHDNLAVKFFKAPVAQPEIHDVRVVNAMNKQAGAIFLHPNDSLNVWTKVENSGNCYEGWYYVASFIYNQTGIAEIGDVAEIFCRVPTVIDSIMFDYSWMPSTTGRYNIKIQTALTSDMCRDNDTLRMEVNVVSNNECLQYETGSNANYCWNRPAGFANQFIPPSYPWPVRGASIYASATSPTDLTVKVYDDNGPNGAPGDVLSQTIVNVSNAQWYQATFPLSSLVINDGSFYIGATTTSANQLSFGMDATPPFSHRLWEFTGTWNPSRFSLNRDACIRSLSFLGIEESPNNDVKVKPVSILPNPFSNFVTIKFANPRTENKSVLIYNSSGVLVRHLDTNDDLVIWDGKNNIGLNLPNGCYFVRLTDDRTKSLHKVIITR